MYQSGMAAKEDAAKRADEHLLGKAVTSLAPAQQPQEEVSRVRRVGPHAVFEIWSYHYRWCYGRGFYEETVVYAGM